METSLASSGKFSCNTKTATLIAIVLIIVSLYSWDNTIELSQYHLYLRHNNPPQQAQVVKKGVKANATVIKKHNATNVVVSHHPGIIPTVENNTNANNARNNAINANNNNITSLLSPACKPHFKVALPNGNWTSVTKFKRLYFYHSRKAGGTNLRLYFGKVARHHGLEFVAEEYNMAEDPGSHDNATFYVTNLREPVARSISHFKYDQRWPCKQLMYNTTFLPTKQNARSLSSWNKPHGFVPPACRTTGKGRPLFRLPNCAVNCYTQWFAGPLSCPRWDPPLNPKIDGRMIYREVPLSQQRDVARRKMLRYNLIIITELLKDDEYVSAVERFLGGVSGLAKRKGHPWCEAESHVANKKNPLVIEEDTLRNLTRLNEVDIGLYREMRDCYPKKEDDDNGEGTMATTTTTTTTTAHDYFPRWDPERFEKRNDTI